MKPAAATRVKVLCGILFSSVELVQQAFVDLERCCGPIDYKSPAVDFDVSDYYVAEMGSPIKRQFVSFERLADPGDLAELKITTNQIEDRLAVEGQRRVNIDIGYLDFDKLVLASAKYNGQKIYLTKGIYADPTLHYSAGTFQPYPTAFPDFRDERYYGFLLEIRKRYKEGVRS